MVFLDWAEQLLVGAFDINPWLISAGYCFPLSCQLTQLLAGEERVKPHVTSCSDNSRTDELVYKVETFDLLKEPDLNSLSTVPPPAGSSRTENDCTVQWDVCAPWALPAAFGSTLVMFRKLFFFWYAFIFVPTFCGRLYRTKEICSNLWRFNE